jgi:hypothetical protein
MTTRGQRTRLGSLTLLLGLWAGASNAFGQSRIFFTDLVSGPNTGGEGNHGAFVTIHGRGFGLTRGTSTVAVGGGLVAAYPLWSDTKVVVHLGPAAASGTLRVNTTAGASNAVLFTVRAGNIYFVSTAGDDGNNGSFATPWRTIPKAKDTIAAGDTAYIMNGVSQIEEDNFGAALSIETSGAPGSPKALVAYPGATATVGSLTPGRVGIRVPNLGLPASDWVFAGLVLRAEAQVLEIGGTGSSRWRVVGNDISCPLGDGQTGCFAASQASYVAFLGNQVHHIGTSTVTQPSKQYHAVYFTTDTNHVEVGWNHIHDNATCRAIQFHSSPLCSPACGPSDTTGFNQYDLSVHDNLIDGDACDGINFATVNPSAGAVLAFNNVIARVGRGPDPPDGSANYAGIYVAGTTNTGGDGTGTVEIFNNTLYDCGAQGSTDAGAFGRGPGSSGITMRLRNNIVRALGSDSYVSPSSTTAGIAGSHNLWFGAGTGPAYLTNNLNADPAFVNPAISDFHLGVGSPAVDSGTIVSLDHDKDGVARPQGGVYDRGAYETPASAIFTDDPLQSGTTPVKVVHFSELRQAIDALRTRFSLGAFAWTDATLTVGATPVKAMHLTELRTALDAVYVALARTAPTYTHATITSGSTVVTAVDVAELRAAILAVW